MPSDNSSHGFVYVIKSRQGSIYKVGFTRNWNRRSKQLEVGRKTAAIKVFFTRDPEGVEKRIHEYWDGMRLPQSEWFTLNTEQVEELLIDIQSISNSVEEEWQKKIKQAKAYRRKEKERQLNVNARSNKTPDLSNRQREEVTQQDMNAVREKQRWENEFNRKTELRKAKQKRDEGLMLLGMAGFFFIIVPLIIHAIQGN